MIGRSVRCMVRCRPYPTLFQRLSTGHLSQMPTFQRRFKGAKRTEKKTVDQEKWTGDQEYDLTEMTNTMDGHLEYLKETFQSIKGEGSDPISVIGELKISADGSTYPIKAVGTVSKKSAQVIVVNLYDSSYTLEAIQAITDYESSFAPALQDDTTIFCATPKITKEYKAKLQAIVKEKSGEVKNGMKREAKAAQANAKKFEDTMAKDDLRNIVKEIDNQTNKKIKLIDDMLKIKLKELS